MHFTDKKIFSKSMLSFDRYNHAQKDFNYLEVLCAFWMRHYNLMLNKVENSEVDEFFIREHYNEFKWYDV